MTTIKDRTTTETVTDKRLLSWCWITTSQWTIIQFCIGFSCLHFLWVIVSCRSNILLTLFHNYEIHSLTQWAERMFSPMFDALHFENNGCIERWGIQYVSECSTVTVNPNDSDIILLYKDVARSNVLYVAERLLGLNYI